MVNSVESEQFDRYVSIRRRIFSLSEVEREEVLTMMEKLLTGVSNIIQDGQPGLSENNNFFANFNPASARKLRKDLGFSQEDLSQKIKVHHSSISRYETGKLRPSGNSDEAMRYAAWLNENGYCHNQSSE